MRRMLKLYPLPVLVGAGLVTGLAARLVVGAPQVGQWIFLATLVAGGGTTFRGWATRWLSAGGCATSRCRASVWGWA